MSVTVNRILHAGYLFASAGTRLIFDPVFENPFSGNCHAFPDVSFDADAVRRERFDAVVISHYHDDHCSIDSLALIDRATPVYTYCVHDEVFNVILALGFTRVIRIELDQAFVIGAFTVTPRRALDDLVDCVFHVRAGDVDILNVVDAWINDEVLADLKTNAPWDLVLWPFQTMRELAVLSPRRADPFDPELLIDGIKQLASLSPRYVVPSSHQFRLEPWSWMNRALLPVTYRAFGDLVREYAPAAALIRLDPGRGLTIGANACAPAAPLPWVTIVGAAEVDYEFDPHAPVPSTAAVALNFRAPTTIEVARARAFAEDQIFARYRALAEPESPFFAKPRRWSLTLHAAGMEPLVYDYVASPDELELAPDPAGRIAPAEWTTEIPLIKLIDALDHGATLPSLYVRINDRAFAPAVEVDLRALDPGDLVEDPLLRCLYEGGGAADYQRAQLARRGTSC